MVDEWKAFWAIWEDEFQNFLHPWWMNQRHFWAITQHWISKFSPTMVDELKAFWAIREMEAKVAEQLDKINFFVNCWKLAHLIFLIFCIKLEGIKGYKLPQMPFWGNFSFCRFWPFLLIFGPKKSTFLYNYCSKLADWMFLIFCIS